MKRTVQAAIMAGAVTLGLAISLNGSVVSAKQVKKTSSSRILQDETGAVYATMSTSQFVQLREQLTIKNGIVLMDENGKLPTVSLRGIKPRKVQEDTEVVEAVDGTPTRSLNVQFSVEDTSVAAKEADAFMINALVNMAFGPKKNGCRIVGNVEGGVTPTRANPHGVCKLGMFASLSNLIRNPVSYCKSELASKGPSAFVSAAVTDSNCKEE